MRSLSPLSRRILKKAGIAAAFFCSAFLFGSVLSHFTCRALRKAAPVFLSAAPETPVSSVSMPVLSSAAENWGLSFPEKGKTPVGNATSEELAAYNAWFAASPEENIIYLTFDCGYENGNTENIMAALKKHNAPATFFVVGNFLETSPDLVKKMVKEGYTVGNHTYHHVQLNKLNETKAREEILKTNNLIYETTGVYPLYLRPPFGAWKKNLELCVEMLPVFWTIDTLDWKVQNTEKIVRTVQEQIEDGAIILMHDEYDTSVEAALQVVDELKNQGYELVTVDQLILP